MIEFCCGSARLDCRVRDWYNHEHLHSGIRYVSPAAQYERHDRVILAARHQVYERARQRHPSRWRRHTRNRQPVVAVTLNPERDAMVEGIQLNHDKQPLAA